MQTLWGILCVAVALVWVGVVVGKTYCDFRD